MLKKTFSTACVIFTCLVALYSLVNLALYGENTDSYLALSSLRVFLFFPFSLLLAFGSHILNAKRLDIWLRVILHYILTITGAYLFLILPMGEMKATATMMGLFLFTVLYIVSSLVIGLVGRSLRGRKNDEKDYTPVYRAEDKAADNTKKGS